MITQNTKKQYDEIISHLNDGGLKLAFESIKSLINCNREVLSYDELNEWNNNYKYMLRYAMEGIKDPLRGQIYNNLVISTYELAETMKHKLLEKDEPTSYYINRRNLHNMPTLSYEQLHKQLLDSYETTNYSGFDEENNILFNKIWGSNILTQEEEVQLKNLLEDEHLPFVTGCQIVSAFLLSLLDSFDKGKMKLLFIAASHKNYEIKARALINLLIVLYLYKNRKAYYPQLTNLLAALNEEPGFTHTLQTITLRFILARETEKITRKLQEEIIPEMIKLTPNLGKNINMKDMKDLNELTESDMNPEWEKMFADSNLGKKIEEFGDLQQEGADVMHSTFIHLKNYPFFREVGNWFMPFSMENPSIHSLMEQSSFEQQALETMTSAAFMCNSDKYSLYFSMMQLPQPVRQMMMGQFDSQASEAAQQSKAEIITKRGEMEIIMIQYIQDLYRFFKLNPRHEDFIDIFKLPLDFHNLEILKPYLSDEESLMAIAEYYMRKMYYKDALTVFNQFIEKKENDDQLFQKIGYCKDMMGDTEGALDAFLRAELLNPDSRWVIRRIASCYRILKQPEKAIEYYNKLTSRSDETYLSLDLNIGNCLLELKRYDEALKYFFKVDYLDGKNHKAWRGIAWCSFLLGKFEQAHNYYQKILSEEPTEQDYLNAAHTEWAMHNIKGAVELYEKVVKEEMGDINPFKEMFDSDKPYLLAVGIDNDDIPLMFDQVIYYVDHITGADL